MKKTKIRATNSFEKIRGERIDDLLGDIIYASTVSVRPFLFGMCREAQQKERRGACQRVFIFDDSLAITSNVNGKLIFHSANAACETLALLHRLDSDSNFVSLNGNGWLAACLCSLSLQCCVCMALRCVPLFHWLILLQWVFCNMHKIVNAVVVGAVIFVVRCCCCYCRLHRYRCCCCWCWCCCCRHRLRLHSSFKCWSKRFFRISPHFLCRFNTLPFACIHFQNRTKLQCPYIYEISFVSRVNVAAKTCVCFPWLRFNGRFQRFPSMYSSQFHCIETCIGIR